jgi:hypothetical protein
LKIKFFRIYRENGIQMTAVIHKTSDSNELLWARLQNSRISFIYFEVIFNYTSNFLTRLLASRLIDWGWDWIWLWLFKVAVYRSFEAACCEVSALASLVTQTAFITANTITRV